MFMVVYFDLDYQGMGMANSYIEIKHLAKDKWLTDEERELIIKCQTIESTT